MPIEKMEYEIVNRLGLHARAAAQLVQTANRFLSDVMIEKDLDAYTNIKWIVDDY